MIDSRQANDESKVNDEKILSCMPSMENEMKILDVYSCV
jgi:hypothetical protein